MTPRAHTLDLVAGDIAVSHEGTKARNTHLTAVGVAGEDYLSTLGDKVIQRVANILKAHVRATDLIVRYGGDEFLILLEHITDVEALSIADQIRRDVDSSNMQAGLAQELHVSISAGYAVGAASWLELFHKADQSLFKAKAKGKNAVQG